MAYIDPSGRLDWLTPRYVQDDWVDQIMGGIDLDPCGNPKSVLTTGHQLLGDGVKGDANDGMTAAWHTYGDGRIYFNPTYGERLPKAKKDKPPPPPMPCFYPLSQWIIKAHSERTKGAHVFALLPASTGKQWFHMYAANPFGLEGLGSVMCFLSKRVEFRLPEMPEDEKSQPGSDHMCMFMSLDDDLCERFAYVMEPYGMVVDSRR